MYEAAIEKLKELEKHVRECSKGFYHSVPLVRYNMDGKELTYDLRDLLLMCAISENNVMHIGKTDGGKTTIARMFMAALFGDDYGFLQVDATLNIN